MYHLTPQPFYATDLILTDNITSSISMEKSFLLFYNAADSDDYTCNIDSYGETE